uniref:Chemokine interleukin-8-like domain-containing protein n=1 Tax=Nothobranchius furzeri TaxID=105023 RepID=A0A8C6NNZ0_NOTFU
MFLLFQCRFHSFRSEICLIVCHLHFMTMCNFNLTGRSVRSLGVEPHCRCIETESRRIGPRIAKFELISANSHCERLEIIATLKQSGKEVCLNPEAPWVRKLIENMIPK